MTLLHELADFLGFHKSYFDSFGNEVFANVDALKKLISAMGFDVSSEQAIFNHLTELKEKSWRELMPKVHIEPAENQQHSLVISLPQVANLDDNSANSSNEITIKIAAETGEIHQMNYQLSELEQVDSIQLGEHHYAKYRLPLPSLPLGYHQLTITFANTTNTCSLIYAPKTCYSIEQASNNKVWGFATQLYSLKSESNWGMGDFSDLFSLSKDAAARGAAVIGVNPLHPLFSVNPEHCSPYSPTSRSFLNTLYIDPQNTPLFKQCKSAQAQVNSDDFQEKLNSLKTSALINYSGVYTLKRKVLSLLFDQLQKSNSAETQALQLEFCDYKHQQGEPLLQLATYEALYQHFQQLDSNAYGWKDWPQSYHSYHSQAVKEFQLQYSELVEYYCFLQWLAHQQLNAVTQLCEQAEMPIGLYLDLAVGCDGSGVEVWANPKAYLNGAAVGAPPDQMNLLGQNWGLTPVDPIELAEQAYQPLIKALHDNMQYAGALRIDHILGLKRQYWVAPGMAANEGTYISFPFDDILRIIALESQRNHCVVIGEDLGTVPEGFTAHMQQAGLLSYKVMYFERWESGLFKRPETYDKQSMATVSTHDLPTLKGWWQGNDLHWREQLNLYPNEHMAAQEQDNRVLDRQRLLAALIDLNVIDNDHCPAQLPPETNHEFMVAVQAFLAHSTSHLQLIQLEDCIELLEQANIPGTIDEHPNWRRKLPLTTQQLWQHPTMEKLISTLNHIRPKKIIGK